MLRGLREKADLLHSRQVTLHADRVLVRPNQVNLGKFRTQTLLKAVGRGASERGHGEGRGWGSESETTGGRVEVERRSPVIPALHVNAKLKPNPPTANSNPNANSTNRTNPNNNLNAFKDGNPFSGQNFSELVQGGVLGL